MRENPALSKNDLCQALIQIPALSPPLQSEQVRHSPAGSILRITETACSRENFNCRDVNLQTVWDCANSEETRPYHSEKQEEGGIKGRRNRHKTEKRKEETHGFSPDRGAGGWTPKHTSMLILVCSVHLNLRGLTEHNRACEHTHLP